MTLQLASKEATLKAKETSKRARVGTVNDVQLDFDKLRTMKKDEVIEQARRRGLTLTDASGKKGLSLDTIRQRIKRNRQMNMSLVEQLNLKVCSLSIK